jgi:hypothetical protein
MTDIVSARIVAQTLASSAAAAPPAPPSPVSQSAAAHFRALLQPAELAPPAGDAAAVRAAPASDALAATTAPALPPAPGSFGDLILQGMQKVHGSLSSGLESTEALIDPRTGPMSTTRLLQFQVKMLDMGFQYQMVASVATKTAQNIDQLVKMQ